MGSMIALNTPPEAALADPFDPLRADQRSDDELDQLPFGVICLDAAGKIVRYNLAEARFARLDRATVLGKTFFGQVAPCTARPEFQGRFQLFVKPGNTAPTDRWQYVFDFKFGAQEVDIELVRGGLPNRYYLLVNRQKFLPVREKPFRPAPSQADLAPGEAQAGVARDANEQRSVQISPAFFASMRATWDKVAPQGWPVFCAEWGQRWGRNVVVDLETEALEKLDRTLRELPMKTVIVMVAEYLSRQGWGQLAADFSSAKQGAFVLTLSRSALAESVGFSEVPRCHLFGGFFRAIFCHLANKLLMVREVSCAAQGHPRCSFVVASVDRRAALEAALVAGEGEVAKVLQRFVEAR
jgi:photoactive yellow protein